MSLVGFIGLGNMGAHMARNLLRNGHKLVVYDAIESATHNLKSHGAEVAGCPADVAAQTNQLITMLPSSPHVRDVYTGTKGLFETMQPGSLCIDSSTIDPAVAQQMCHLASDKSSSYLDSPVSGGVVAAEGASLTFMVGGEKTAFDNAQSLLKLMGKNVIHCGPSGTGQAAKICNNMMLAISMIGVAETLTLGQRLGLDPNLLAKIMNTSTGRCWASDTYNPCPGIIEGVPSSRGYTGGFGTTLMTKDLGLAQNAATATQTPTPLGSLAHQIYRLLSQSPEFQTKDFSVIYQFLKTNSSV